MKIWKQKKKGNFDYYNSVCLVLIKETSAQKENLIFKKLYGL